MLVSVKRVRTPVVVKVVIPFLVLSMLAGLLASGLIGLVVASSARAQVDAEAIREEDSVGASFATFEQRQLTVLRGIVATDGVPAAMETANVDQLQRLMVPVIANQLPDPLRVTDETRFQSAHPINQRKQSEIELVQHNGR